MSTPMRCLKTCLAAYLCVLFVNAGATGLHKWVDANGVTHYSQHPPENIEEVASEKVKSLVDTAFSSGFLHPQSAPGMRVTLYFPMKANWKVVVAPSPIANFPGTLHVTRPEGEFKILITTVPMINGRSQAIPDRVTHQATQREMNLQNPPIAGDLLEQEPEFRYHAADKHTVSYFTIKDPRYENRQPPEKEYIYTTVADIKIENVSSFVTILSNDLRSADYQAAISMLKSLQVMPSEFNRLARPYQAIKAISDLRAATSLIEKAEDKSAETQYLFGEFMKNSTEHDAWRFLMQQSAAQGFRPALQTLMNFVESGEVPNFPNGTELDDIAPLPEPPAGFAWHRQPPSISALLVPNDWHVKTASKGSTELILIAPDFDDPDVDPLFFVNIEFSPETTDEIDVNVLAQLMRLDLDEQHETIRSWQSSQGSLSMYGLEYIRADVETKHHVTSFFANERTGTLTIISFISVDANWTEAWKIGEVIMRNLILDDDT